MKIAGFILVLSVVALFAGASMAVWMEKADGSKYVERAGFWIGVLLVFGLGLYFNKTFIG